MAHEALAHPQRLRFGAAAAQPGRGDVGRSAGGWDVGRTARAERRMCGHGLGRWRDGLCPCDQWSRSRPRWATLVRHVLLKATAAPAIAKTLAPTPRALGMSEATAPRSLVSACAVAPGSIASQPPARATAVAVATVTAAAQHDLSAALRAQEQAGWWVHAHLGEPKVLDAIAPAGHTMGALPSSARCRARHGRLACRQEGSLPRPPSSAWVMLYPSAAITAGCLGAHSAKAHPSTNSRLPQWQLSPAHRLCLAGPPCRAAQQGTPLQPPPLGSTRDQNRVLTSE